MSTGWGIAAEATFVSRDRDGGDVARGLKLGEVAVAADLAAIYGTPAELAALGDRMAAKYYSDRTAAVDDVADQFSRIVPGEGTGFSAFTCSEANALARMLALFGHFDTAVNVIQGHAESDDGGDEHGYIRELGGDNDEGPGAEAAAVFVRRMMGDADAQPSGAAAKRAELNHLRSAGDDPDAPGVMPDRIRDRIVQLSQELGEEGGHDPDDVADLVAHDAAVGLPGFTPVGPHPAHM